MGTKYLKLRQKKEKFPVNNTWKIIDLNLNPILGTLIPVVLPLYRGYYCIVERALIGYGRNLWKVLGFKSLQLWRGQVDLKSDNSF